MSTTRPPGGARVLIIDDEGALVTCYATILEAEGYRVTAVPRGGAADERLRMQAHDVVLLDLCTSGVSGAGLLNAAVGGLDGPKVIAMTSLSIESRLEARRSGAWACLPRPFSAEQLRILVGRAARDSRSRRAADG